ncbi:Hexosyltransferase [Fasciola hepatica]|uniref:Hexosyltransferase n=1 Tax=Fasciola hepatica TaxID=6192 RepID=A0A4E0R751_FASHE|nr:Hexosyltransferase [Fasciola hepatica]
MRYIRIVNTVVAVIIGVTYLTIFHRWWQPFFGETYQGRPVDNVSVRRKTSSENKNKLFTTLRYDDEIIKSETINPMKKKNLPWIQRYYQLLSLLYVGHVRNGSLAYRAYEMEKQLRVDPEAYNYHFYPQSVDLDDVVKTIQAGKPSTTKPINNPHVPVLATPTNMCKDESGSGTFYDLLVAIKTCVQCVGRRMHARSTFMTKNLWGRFRIRFFFVTGLPSKSQPNFFHFDGINVSFPKRRYNEVGWWVAQTNLFSESSRYGDLLVGDFEDHYYSLYTKQLFTFRWLSANCTRFSKLFLFLDDDYGVLPVNLIRFVQSLPSEILPSLNVGIRFQNQFLVRDKRSKWGMSRNEIPWPIYAPYFAGAAFMLGKDVLTDLAIGMLFQAPGRIDDAVMGITMFRLRYPVYTTKKFSHYVDSTADMQTKVCAPTTYIDKYFDWRTNSFRQKK